ncbi:MAG: cobalamin-dependent protein, partial [Rhizobiaceae bacterium]|nr:cobalamin-dependent protein [Rhizobiaceae bacterium]
VGVNKYRLPEEAEIETLEIDNRAVREGQVRRLEKVRAFRDPALWRDRIDRLKYVARTAKGNLLEAAVEAARARATVGEISDAMREAFGDHSAIPDVVTEIYGPASDNDPEYQMLVSRLRADIDRTGKRPRILVAKLGQDGHDRGAKVIASAFSDIGFEVIAGPLFQTPDEAADLAIEKAVDVVGVSSLAAGHKTLLPELVDGLRAKGAGHIIVVCGGVIPRKDYQFLMDRGVSAVFGPGTNVVDAARAVLDLAEGRLRNE